MQELKALEGKSLAELREIARALGIQNIMVKKRELIQKIVGETSDDATSVALENPELPQPRKRGRRPRTAVVSEEAKQNELTQQMELSEERAASDNSEPLTSTTEAEQPMTPFRTSPTLLRRAFRG